MKRSRWDTDPSPPKPPPSAPKSRWDTQVPSSKSPPASLSSSPVPPPSSAPSAPYKRPQPLTFGCNSVENYERLSHIDEGTYGIVWKARSLKTNSLVALKQLKFPESESQAVGFPVAALREISVLQDLSHPHILSTHEMVIGSTSSKVFMVMNLMSCDVKVAIERLPEVMSQGEAKSVMRQLVSAVEYMHGKFYLHRDLKTSNVLVSRDTGKVSICDFGLARKYEIPLKSYTQMVITLWYRCPELLLGETLYGPEVDMWSLGCMFAEILNLEVLFQGQGEVDQLNRIFKLLGVPNGGNWEGFEKLPHANTFSFKGPKGSKLREAFPSNSFSGKTYLNDGGFDLLSRMLSKDPKKRISAGDAAKHHYFTEAPKMTEVRWVFEDEK